MKAHDFTYNSVVLCGPPGIESYTHDEFPTINAYKYFYIHKSTDGKIIVWNDFYQFADFKKINYSNLFVQNGGTTMLRYSVDERVERYTLRIENHKTKNQTHEKTLLVASSSGTFISRVTGYAPMTGVCNKIK